MPLAVVAPHEEDKALAKLQQMEEEFVAHKARLQGRTQEIHAGVTAGKYDLAALGGLIVELYLEFHDTGLSFQQDLARLIREEWAADDEEDEEEDDVDEEDETLPEGAVPDEELDSQLLPGDAAQLRRSTTDMLALLDAMLADPALAGATQRGTLEGKRNDAQASLELINEIEITDEEPADSN